MSKDHFEVEVVLADPADQKQKLSLWLIPHTTPISNRWINCLTEILQGNYWLEKNFSFMGFLSPERDLNFLAEQLQQAITTINNFSTSGNWKHPYYISEDYSPSSLVKNHLMNRDLLNALHHHFEILHGPVWQASAYVSTADQATVNAIRQLNFLCHEIEQLLKTKYRLQFAPSKVSGLIIASFLSAPRFSLHDEDYDNFSLEQEFGTVYMHYCQVGKTHWEAFSDKDEIIDKRTITGLRYYSGEFDIVWGPNYREQQWWLPKRQQFFTWLKQQGFDASDKRLGLGRLPIAKVDLSRSFATTNHFEIYQIISKYLDIAKITIWRSENVYASKTFPYSWSDPTFTSGVLHELSNF